MKTTEIDYKGTYLAEINSHWNQWYGKIGRFILNSIFSLYGFSFLLVIFCYLFSSEANPLDSSQIASDIGARFGYYAFLPFPLYAAFRQYLKNRKIENLRLLAELQNYRENLLFNSNKFSTISIGREFYASLNPLNRHTLLNEISITNDLLSALLQHFCNHNNLNIRDEYINVTELLKK